MLEKPDLQDEKIIVCLQEAYGLRVVQVAFLPRGVDLNAAVYRAITADETSYFVKLRRGDFDETSVALPKFLSDQGLAQIIAPLATKTGQLWGNLEAFTVIVYPFIEGRNGYEVPLSERHWRDFGAALKSLHTAAMPAALTGRIQREAYSALARRTAKTFLSRLVDGGLADPVAIKLAEFLRAKSSEIQDLIERAERLARELQARGLEFTVCHSDIHAGNILIDVRDAFYIVDWDNPILAPKERDLMFIGGGQGFVGYTPQLEETLFYHGYGQTQIDPSALAYYRYERIIQDIAAFCEQITNQTGREIQSSGKLGVVDRTPEGRADREQALRYLISNFLPNNTIEIAYASDQTHFREPNAFSKAQAIPRSR